MGRIKLNKKSTLKIMSATMMTVFSLFSVFMGTYAWFTSQNSVNGEANSMEVINVSKSFSSLKIYDGNYVSNNYVFDMSAPVSVVTSSDNDHASVPMGTFTNSNRHHPILFVIEYERQLYPSDENPLNIIASTANTRLFVGDKANDGAGSGNLIDSKFPLSSFIHTYAVGYEGDLPIENNTLTYSASTIEATDSYSFVTFSGSSFDFSTQTNFAHFTSGNYKKIAVILDYYDAAIEYVYSAYLGTDVLQGDASGYIHFKCDWNLAV